MHLATTDTEAPALPQLRINYDLVTNRVNPAELRHLRQVVAATTISCVPTAVQVEVTRAYHEGMDLTQEARVLLSEFGLPSAPASAPMRTAR